MSATTTAPDFSVRRPRAAARRSKTRDLRFSLVIKAKPEALYRALTSATELCRWWLQGAETDARSAGRFRMIWPKVKCCENGSKSRAFPPHVAVGDSEGCFVDLEPGRKVAWLFRSVRGGAYPALASFFILPRGRSSELTLVQAGFSSSRAADKYFQGCAAGWEDCLAKLKLYLETGRACKTQVLTFAGLKTLAKGAR